jgi:hypothetical protein
MVVQRVGAGHQLAQSPEEMFQAQVGAYAFVKGIFVEDHADFPVAAS